MSSKLAARVNHEQLVNFVGEKVKIVGKIVSASTGSAQLETSDGQKISIMGSSPEYSSSIAEITGTAVNANSVREISSVSLGDNFGKFI
ncbi:hypothetical protein MHBO_003675 [Bonamia ostreae]|uniref:Replication factor A protein 3 n=1 Tax=Bonamia ostreae TaxID=126728 RepID=A0ABV2AR75_9EUKA